MSYLNDNPQQRKCRVRDFLLNNPIFIRLAAGHLKASVFCYADDDAGRPGSSIAGRL